MSLIGKTAVVTGSNSGIGLGIARELARSGASVILNSFTDSEEDHSLATEISREFSVFVPTTPNPTSGFLLFFPKSDVIVLDMTVEDAAKLVISAGLVYPGGKDPHDMPSVVKDHDAPK